MGAIRDILLKPKREETPLLDEIRQTVTMISAAHKWFDSEKDADLIEACVFQLESLEAKYRYLLRLAKDTGLSREAMTGGEMKSRRTA